MEFSQRLEQIWKSGTIKWALPGSFILAAFWGFLDKPSPGIAVGILGAAAAIMSLRGEIHIFEKSAWIAIIFTLIVAEVLAIKRSDDETARQRVEQARKLDALNKQAEGLNSALRQSITQSQEQFTATMESTNSILGTTRGVAKLSKENLESVTGGDKIAALTIMPSLPNRAGDPQGDIGTAMVFAPSGGIVRGVRVRVVNIALFDQDSKSRNLTAHDMNFVVGDISTTEAIPLAQQITLGPGIFVRFNIFFGGLNGWWNENLLLRKKDGEWHEAIRVFRKYTKLKNQTERDVVYKKIDPAYLEKNEKMNWDAMP